MGHSRASSAPPLQVGAPPGHGAAGELHRLRELIFGDQLVDRRLADKVDNLRRTRDLQLSRLLSGQISLGEATEQAQDQTQATANLADASLVG